MNNLEQAKSKLVEFGLEHKFSDLRKEILPEEKDFNWYYIIRVEQKNLDGQALSVNHIRCVAYDPYTSNKRLDKMLKSSYAILAHDALKKEVKKPKKEDK